MDSRSGSSLIAQNLAQIQQRIADASQKAERVPEEITLVAVSKLKPLETILEAIDAGIDDIGENYVQEASEKQTQLRQRRQKIVRWHLLGHLQSNKAKAAVATFDLIQSVDSVKIAQTIDRQAGMIGKRQEILLQVHLGNEETKFGVLPETALERAAEIAAFPHLALRGLMGIAPFGTEVRPYFRSLRRLFERLPAPNRQILSMGMTADFETAIEEGTTMVRIGTAIFGKRAPYPG